VESGFAEEQALVARRQAKPAKRRILFTVLSFISLTRRRKRAGENAPR
jgi:hypothetical protein